MDNNSYKDISNIEEIKVSLDLLKINLESGKVNINYNYEPFPELKENPILKRMVETKIRQNIEKLFDVIGLKNIKEYELLKEALIRISFEINLSGEATELYEYYKAKAIKELEGNDKL